MDTLDMPVPMTEGEYRHLIAEIEKYRALATSVPAKIVVEQGKYTELIGNTTAIVAAELTALKEENERLKARVASWIDMTENCAGVPTSPDSLVQMLLHEFRVALKTEKPSSEPSPASDERQHLQGE